MARPRKLAARSPRRATARPQRSHVQSLARALSILNALAEEDPGLTLSELVQKVGLAPSTTHRLLTTLQDGQYVRFESERNLWSVGLQAFVVGSAFARSRDLVLTARPFMRQLMEQSGETVNLAIEDDGQAVYMAQVECCQAMRAITHPGGRVPLHCSGVGKALLAAMPKSEVTRILRERGMLRLTPKTINSPAKLRQELDRSRALGYAMDDEEHAVGLRCVAAPIYDEWGRALGGLSLSGPMARVTDARFAALGAMVAEMAGKITLRIGGKTPDWSS